MTIFVENNRFFGFKKQCGEILQYGKQLQISEEFYTQKIFFKSAHSDQVTQVMSNSKWWTFSKTQCSLNHSNWHTTVMKICSYH